jgi:hypothetical protein
VKKGSDIELVAPPGVEPGHPFGPRILNPAHGTVGAAKQDETPAESCREVPVDSAPSAVKRQSRKAPNGEILRVIAQLAERAGTDSHGSCFIDMRGGHRVRVDVEDYYALTRVRWTAKRSSTTPNRICSQHSTWMNGKRATLAMHRILASAKPGQIVDHINGDPLDNRRSNLRLCDAAGNSRNVTSSKRQKAGGFKGVTWHPKGKKWEAGCCSGPRHPGARKRKRVYLGLFSDPVEAARAYDREALKAFGEFASLNFPEDGPAHAIDIGLSALCAPVSEVAA